MNVIVAMTNCQQMHSSFFKHREETKRMTMFFHQNKQQQQQQQRNAHAHMTKTTNNNKEMQMMHNRTKKIEQP